VSKKQEIQALFEEVLKKYQDRKHGEIGDYSANGDQEATDLKQLEREVKNYRKRLDSLLLAQEEPCS